MDFLPRLIDRPSQQGRPHSRSQPTEHHQSLPKWRETAESPVRSSSPHQTPDQSPQLNKPRNPIPGPLQPVRPYAVNRLEPNPAAPDPSHPQSKLRGGGVGSGVAPKRQCSSGVRVDARSIGASIPQSGERVPLCMESGTSALGNEARLVAADANDAGTRVSRDPALVPE
jgi:hypothetical protein